MTDSLLIACLVLLSLNTAANTALIVWLVARNEKVQKAVREMWHRVEPKRERTYA